MLNMPVKDTAIQHQPQGWQYISTYFTGLREAINSISMSEVSMVVEIILEAGKRGNRIFICGNGGSAATASHMACDLAKGCRVEGFQPFKAFALTDSMAQLTAWANDTSYENCFAGQLEGLGQPGDLLIAISGSGNSANVLKAVETARKLGMTSIGLAGFQGGKLKGLVDYSMVIPASNIEQVEDVHMILEHTIATTLRQMMMSEKGFQVELAS
jgi:D-sedoheptulose 7-phosphate isomerase